MAMRDDGWQADGGRRGDALRASGLRDFWRLCKPNVMQLVIFTSAVALYLAPGRVHPLLDVHRPDLHRPGCRGVGRDQQLVRRRHRPPDGAHPAAARRPSGRIEPAEALAVGVTLAIISVMLMGLALNWLAAALLALTIAFYVFVYTMWLKRRTPQNIVIGGAAGALPPMVAWAAVTGEVALLPVLMFAIIFLWTPPHFWALALYRTGDYDRVGVPMLPVVAGRRSTLRPHPGLHGRAGRAVSLLPTALGLAGLALRRRGARRWACVFLGYAVPALARGSRPAGDAHLPLLDLLPVPAVRRLRARPRGAGPGAGLRWR